MQYASLHLNKQADRRIKRGHPWIYSNEVDTNRSPFKSFSAGEPVVVHSASGQVLGSAIINPNALICGRIFSHNPDAKLDRAFFADRIRTALDLRETLFSQPYYRLVYGDSDFLPGVVVDRFNEHAVVQLTLAGMDRVREDILAALDEVIRPKGLVVRHNHSAREQENLADEIVAVGDIPESLTVVENGCQFHVAATSGQKTGWFYDHRPNRALLQPLVKGKSVLDVFSYAGGWGVQCAAAGANEVVCVDASRAALDYVNTNAALNSCGEKIFCMEGKAVEVLKQLVTEKKKFDVVVLDPPAFIKKRKDQKAGEAAYRHLNELALQLLNSSGILVSASCSMPLIDDILTDIVRAASWHQRRPAQLFYRGSQGMDHPVHPAIPETRYLKAQFFRLH